MRLIYVPEKKLFLFHCSYFQRKIPQKAGLKYKSKSKLWYTYNPDKALKLYEYADEDLKKKFDQYKGYIKKKIRKSFKASSNFRVPKPEGLEFDYFPYQKAGIEFAVNRKYTLLADEMGLGKTIQAIGTLNHMKDPKRVMIICPNSMKGVWKKELNTWLIHDMDISVNSSAEFRLADIMIINYEAFRFSINKKSKDFRDPKKGKYNSTLELFKDLRKLDNIDLLILDESHRIKNYSANTTRNIFKLKSKIGVSKALFLTGTPIFSRPDEIWTTIKFFGETKKFKGTKSDFMEYYQDAYFDQRWKRMVTREPQHLEELQRLLRTSFMIRRTKKQVFPDMPEKMRKIVPVEVNRSKFKQYDYLLQDVHDISKLDHFNPEQSLLRSLKPEDISQIAELRRLAGVEKIQPTIEYIDELLEAGEKVIVFGHHKKVLNKLKKKYKNCAFITGDVPSDDRLAEVEKFQNDPECKVFIANIIAGGVGLTLTASSNVVFLEMDFVPANMLQAEDRAHRHGQTKSVTCHYMVAEDTLDAYIAEMIIKKQEIFEKMIEKEHL